MSVRCLWSQWDILEVIEGILYRRFETSDNSKNRLQAIVPYNERINVLFQCHDNKTSAHLGVRKTIERIRQKYYRPGLQADVRRYIKGCEFCNRRKNPCRTNKAPMQFKVVILWNELLLIFWENFQKPKKGNRYILVVSDYFSKWTESFAMPNMEAVTVANLIGEQVVARFGVPSYLHSDQGRQFESKLFSEMCRLLNIKKTRTTPYHPQSDGQVERFNKKLETMLSAYVNDNHKDWVKHLSYVMMAYRSAEHETTCYNPNYLMFGREVSTPIDLMYEIPVDVQSFLSNQWALELKERLEDTHEKVRQNTKSSMLRQKRYHDLKLSWQDFRENDEAYVYFPVKKVGLSSKLPSYWRGPFKVLEKCTNVTYKVNCGQRGKTQIIHVDRLRKRNPQILKGESVEQLEPPETQSDMNEEIVEREPEV